MADEFQESDDTSGNVLIEDLAKTNSSRNKRSQNVLYMDGFCYFTNKVSPKVRYMKCSKYIPLKCRATAIIPLHGNVKKNRTHNHPPDFTLERKMMFRNMLRETAQVMKDRTPAEIYRVVADKYKDIAHFFPLEKVREQIRGYVKKAQHASQILF